MVGYHDAAKLPMVKEGEEDGSTLTRRSRKMITLSHARVHELTAHRTARVGITMTSPTHWFMLAGFRLVENRHFRRVSSKFRKKQQYDNWLPQDLFCTTAMPYDLLHIVPEVGLDNFP
jgi:hypothetical protein